MGTVIFHSEYSARFGGNVGNYIAIDCDARVSFSETYNEATNKSTIAISKIELKNNTDVNFGSVSFFGSVSVNGTTLIDIDNETTVRTISLPADGAYHSISSLPTSGTVSVAHNNDGTGSFTMALGSCLLQESKYYFCGLYLSPTSVRTPVGIQLPSSQTVNLTSRTRQWTVAYSANGGSGAPSAQTKKYGVTLKLSGTIPTRAGYDFLGWAKSSASTAVAYAAGANYTANEGVTLYAVWKLKTYAVTYNANGGDTTPAVQTKTHGVALTLRGSITRASVVTNGAKVSFNANGGSSTHSPVVANNTTDFVFRKWNTRADGTGTEYSAGGSYTTNASVTLFAQWTSTVTGGAVTLPAAPTRSGYTFLGWYTAATGGTRRGGAGGSYTPTSSETLYAHWQAQASTIYSADAEVYTLGKFSLTMKRASAVFFHKVTFSAANLSAVTWGPFGSSISDTVPREWFAGYPSATAISVTYSVQTYKTSACAAGDEVGDPATGSFILRADAGMKPTVASGWISAVPYNTGAVASMSGYIKGYSRARIIFDASKITHATGASVALYSIVCQGETNTATPFCTPVLTSTSVKVTCTVADTRGRKTSETLTISVMDYSKPTITDVSAFRCNEQGEADDAGTYYSVRAAHTYSSLGGQNSCSFTAAQRKGTAAYGIERDLTDNVARVVGPISVDASYTVRISATDSLGNSIYHYVVIPTEKWAMRFRLSGGELRGVAFGKAPEYDDAFEVSPEWQIRSSRPSQSAFLNAHGTSGASAGFTAARTDTGASVSLAVGSGGIMHGVYSNTLGKWIAYADAQDVYLKGTADKVAGGVTFGSVNIANAASGLLTVGGAKRGLLITAGPSVNDKSVTVFASTTAGSLSFATVFAGSNISVASTTAGEIKISNSGSNYISAISILTSGA